MYLKPVTGTKLSCFPLLHYTNTYTSWKRVSTSIFLDANSKTQIRFWKSQVISACLFFQVLDIGDSIFQTTTGASGLRSAWKSWDLLEIFKQWCSGTQGNGGWCGKAVRSRDGCGGAPRPSLSACCPWATTRLWALCVCIGEQILV